MSEPIDPHELERLRRSIAMLRPDQPAGMKREEAIRYSRSSNVSSAPTAATPSW